MTEITRVSFPSVKRSCASWGHLSGEFRPRPARRAPRAALRAHAGARRARPYPGRMSQPTTVADVLERAARAAGHPRLTWYGPDGARIELSGSVLANWVTKTVNLLVEELDAGPGTRVLLDLPPHWRTVPWALAAWRTGACVVLPGDGGRAHDGAGRADVGPVDVVVTDRPAAHPAPGRPVVVAVTLASLARRFDGELPAGAVDAAAAVMTYGDALGWVPDVDPAAPALESAGARVPHAGLVARARAATAAAAGGRALEGARALLTVDGGRAVPGPASDVGAVLDHVLTLLAADGSLVLLDPGAAPDTDRPARRARVTADERVTLDLG